MAEKLHSLGDAPDNPKGCQKSARGIAARNPRLISGTASPCGRVIASSRFWLSGKTHVMSVFCLALLILAAGGVPAVAAPTKAETRAWDLANEKFKDAKSLLLWSMVENDFAEFLKKYPDSDNYAEGVVYEARALYEEHKYDAAIALLTAQSPRAGASADKFNYWTARAYLEKKDDARAAEAFARLTRENPTSDLRPEALVREAQAHARLKSWPKVVEDLSEPTGAFQQLAATNSSSDLVVRGLLLLAQAQLIQSNYVAAEKTAAGIRAENSRAELAWERQQLICRIQLESGHASNALASCSNLLAVAGLNADLKDQSILLKGEILESLGRLPEAIQTYQSNVDSALSFERRRDALLRVVELMLQQGKTSEAGAKLDEFWKKNPGAKGTDFELLVHGELLLKEALGAPGLPGGDATLLPEAQADFLKLINGFTNSPYLGKAQLNLGWCYLAGGSVAESQAAFSNAVNRLPVSAEQAVARFNLAQILFQQHDYAGAASNYSALLENPGYARLAGVTNELFEPALYQMVQAGLEQTNSTLAWDAMSKILKWFPDSAAAPRSMLLVGQARTAQAARDILQDCVARFPQSGLLPEVKLAIARTYAEEADWTNALARYEDWIAAYTNDPALPRAEFARAWMTYKSGDSTNAYLLFTNFVSRFRTGPAEVDDLPAKAQFWVGDYFWNQNEFQKAELNYEEIFDKWPGSPLALAARMKAGKAAMARQSPQEAKVYFTYLINTNCPEGLRQEAFFALADANVTPANYSDAISLFRYIAKTYTNSPIAARAWGRLGDCYYAIAPLEAAGGTNAADAAGRALSAYTNAMDAFQQAMQTTNAAIRGEAEFRLAQTYAAMTPLAVDGQKTDYLKQAFEHYLAVFHADGPEAGANLYVVKEAGLNAAKLAEDQGEWDQAIQLYERLQLSLPQLRDNLEKKINSARDNAQKK